jgi:hypothetical protein
MERLGDILTRTLQTVQPAMGFRPVAVSRPKMVLAATINELPSDAAAFLKGADLVIFGEDISPKQIKSTLKRALQVPWGLWLKEGSQPLEAGSAAADFVLFDPGKTGLDLMSEEKLQRIISVDASLDNALLHTISSLPVEAVYLLRYSSAELSWLELMQLRRLSELINKPLLVPVAITTPGLQLRTLWEAGVDGVVIAAAAAGEIGEFRRMLDGIDLPARRKWHRARPTVPQIGLTAAVRREEEEEEEEVEEE